MKHVTRNQKEIGCMNSVPLLSVRELRVSFGGIVALDGVSFDVSAGQVLALIGPNGAGKTTLFNCLSRLYSYDAGDILLEGTSIATQPPHAMAALGVARTFQNLAMFGSMTVIENIMLGAHCRSRAGVAATAFSRAWTKDEDARLRDEAQTIARYLRLEDVGRRLVTELPFAVQKRVELARALASRPKLLLLDEPAAGLNHDELSELSRFITEIRDDQGITVLLVEHHMKLVMDVSDQIVVLSFGRKIAEGMPKEIQCNADVVTAYLGEQKHAQAA